MAGAEQGSVKCRARLGVIVDCARTDVVDQGSAAAAVALTAATQAEAAPTEAGLGRNGHVRTAAGTSGSAGQKNRRTRRLRARVTG